MAHQATLPLLPAPSADLACSPLYAAPAPEFPSALTERLLRSVRRGGPVHLGTIDAPWEPVPGGLAALTRCEGLRFEGLEVSITTRSPKIVDDLDLLVELDRRCSVSVDVTLASLDPFLVRRLEPGAPGGADARARLRMVARLAAEGIAVRLVCTPWRPGLNDGEPALRALVAAARQAGAQDVVPGPLSARPSRLARLRGALTGRAAAVIPEGAEAGLAVLRRLRLEYGFPRLVAGRG